MGTFNALVMNSYNFIYLPSIYHVYFSDKLLLGLTFVYHNFNLVTVSFIALFFYHIHSLVRCTCDSLPNFMISNLTTVNSVLFIP